jgi:uncharacterized membrane protein
MNCWWQEYGVLFVMAIVLFVIAIVLFVMAIVLFVMAIASAAIANPTDGYFQKQLIDS